MLEVEVDEEVEVEVEVLWELGMAAVAVLASTLSKLSGPQTVSRVWPYFQFSASCLLHTISDWKKKLDEITTVTRSGKGERKGERWVV